MHEPGITVAETDRQQSMALGRHWPALWCRDDGAVARKKTLSRLLSREIMVDRKDASQALPCILHWHGGCPTPLSMAKPLAGAGKDKPPEQDMDVIRHRAVRYDAGAIARVLSTLGRTPARGKRGPQTRVAYPRKLYGIPAVDTARRDPHLRALAKRSSLRGAAIPPAGHSATSSSCLVTRSRPMPPLQSGRPIGRQRQGERSSTIFRRQEFLLLRGSRWSISHLSSSHFTHVTRRGTMKGPSH